MFCNFAEGNFLGRLTRSLELKQSKEGKSYVQFSLACNIGTKEKPETLFVRCSAFGKSAELITRFAAEKGRIFIKGNLMPDSYTNKDNEKIVGFKVIVTSFQFIDTVKLDGSKDDFNEFEDEGPASKVPTRPFDVNDIPF